jgi:Domain of unknown function (DUF1772)
VTGALATAAVASAVMFASWALYITLVEHPARRACGPAAGRAQFRASYRRAAPWQASFAVVAFAAGAATAIATGRGAWLAGALAIGAVVPFTLIVIMPTNRTLLGDAPLGDGDTRRLLGRWGRLHAVRAVLGGAGVGAFLVALGQR